jgi:hypothetical protein
VLLAAPWDGLLADSSVGVVSVGNGIWVGGISVAADSSLFGFGLTRFRGPSGAIEICA